MHGVAVKIKSPTMNGLPDRLVILPGGLTCFAEIKSTGKDLSDVQKVVVPMLRRLGHQVYIIDDMQSLETAKQQIRLLC